MQFSILLHFALWASSSPAVEDSDRHIQRSNPQRRTSGNITLSTPSIAPISFTHSSIAINREEDQQQSAIELVYTLEHEPEYDGFSFRMVLTNLHPNMVQLSTHYVEWLANAPDWCCENCEGNSTAQKKMCSAWSKPQAVQISTVGIDFEHVSLESEAVNADDDPHGDHALIITTGDTSSNAKAFDGLNLPDFKITGKRRENVGKARRFGDNVEKCGSELSQYPTGVQFDFQFKHVPYTLDGVTKRSDYGCCEDTGETSATLAYNNDSARGKFENHLSCQPHCGEGCWGYNYNKLRQQCVTYTKFIAKLRRSDGVAGSADFTSTYGVKNCRCYVKSFGAENVATFGPFGTLINPPTTAAATTTTTAATTAVRIPAPAAADVPYHDLTTTTAATTAATTALPVAAKVTEKMGTVTAKQTTAAATTVRWPIHAAEEPSWESKAMWMSALALFILVLLATMFVKYQHRAGSYSTLLETGNRIASVVQETQLDNSLEHGENVGAHSPSKGGLGDDPSIKKMRTIQRCDVNLLEEIQKGAFGEILKAQLALPGEAMYTVAVKRKASENKSESADDDFLAEGLLMAQFSCKYVLGFVGVSTVEMKETWLVLEYCEFGSLFSQLRPVKHLEKNAEPTSSSGRVAANVPTCRHMFVNPEGKIQAALEIATGMAYLAEHNCIHRDLAARNVLISSSYECKVADFGLSRGQPSLNFTTQDYYVSAVGTMALRWSAPENISSRFFSSASDVWSFGVVMHELFTKAELPYQDIPDTQVVLFICDQKQNYRLEKPPTMPFEFYTNIVLPCWEHTPKARPTFGTLTALLQAYTRGSTRGSNLYVIPKKVSILKRNIADSVGLWSSTSSCGAVGTNVPDRPGYLLPKNI